MMVLEVIDQDGRLYWTGLDRLDCGLALAELFMLSNPVIADDPRRYYAIAANRADPSEQLFRCAQRPAAAAKEMWWTHRSAAERTAYHRDTNYAHWTRP